MSGMTRLDWFLTRLQGCANSIRRAFGFKTSPCSLSADALARQKILEYTHHTLSRMIGVDTAFVSFHKLLREDFSVIVENQWLVNGTDCAVRPLTTMLINTRRYGTIDDRRFDFYLPQCLELEKQWRNGELKDAPPLVPNDPNDEPYIRQTEAIFLGVKGYALTSID